MKHLEDSNKHIIEEIVRQVGHLPELYEDARSEKYKKHCGCLVGWCSCILVAVVHVRIPVYTLAILTEGFIGSLNPRISFKLGNDCIFYNFHNSLFVMLFDIMIC